MNTTVPWGMEGVADDTRAAALDAARRSGQSLGDWLDAVIAERGASRRGAARSDHSAEMEAIATQLARLSASGDGSRAPARPGAERFDAGAAIRDAVAEIARRQADLDRHGEAPTPDPQVTPAMTPRSERVRSAAALPRDEAADDAAFRRDPPPSPAGLRRAGIDLSAEVSQTFARFSRDLRDAIQATDARPTVEALDGQIRKIGRTVDGIGASLPDSDAIARIGEQTREMRDLLKATSGRAAPLDGVERQMASLEARLGRLAAAPDPASAPVTPDFADTMAEVRALLGGLQPGAALGSFETRVDEIADRIARGLDARGPVGLIEGLGRRIDEIHTSLRSQLAESAVDTRPLEGLVQSLSDRLGQAREASTDFHQLEIAMRDVAAKIEGATTGADPRGVQAVEAQIARLAERLDRSETSLKTLDGIEHSLGELFAQFEVTRQVAIDAAETAARTAARDTLRAALQTPGLAQRPSDASPTYADQVTRGLDDLRAMHDMAERRTQATLSDIQADLERLAQGMMAAPPQEARASAPEPRRRRGPAEVVAVGSRVAIDPSDMLIEPGSGRDGAPELSTRPESRVAPEPEVASTPDGGDGPASFIAAARRAAQAAQASVASEAVQKASERRSTSRASGTRARPAEVSIAAGTSPLARARQMLARRRRPILLGLAALVLLVGALEVVKLSVQPVDATRIGAAEIAAPSPVRVAALPPVGIEARTPAATPTVTASVTPPAPAAAPVRPPLPTFLGGGPTRAQVSADGVGDGLLSLASSGDAGAQYEVGGRYADGRSVTRDPKQALAWLQKAAAQGLAPAEYRLGSAYEKGLGADRDPALAMGWYAKAADAGNVRAMYNLAVMSAEGAAGKPDYAKAAQWFNKASGFGVRDAEFNLAILYARGLGIEQSLSQSYSWFAIAASQGDADAAKKRDEVGAQLDPKALAAAKAIADAFHAATPFPAANEVTPPPGGWDGVASRGPGASPSAGSKVSQL